MQSAQRRPVASQAGGTARFLGGGGHFFLWGEEELCVPGNCVTVAVTRIAAGAAQITDCRERWGD